jgi:hypothetical protein
MTLYISLAAFSISRGFCTSGQKLLDPPSYNKTSIKRNILTIKKIHREVGRTKDLSALLYIGKGKAVPLQAWSGPEGSRNLKFPDFITTAQVGGKVVSLTQRPPLPQEIHLVLISFKSLSRSQGHSATGRIMSLKNSNDTNGNRTRDLPVCSVVP